MGDPWQTPMVECWVNDRWPLMLPEARAARPEWPWWEANRLSALHHFANEGDVCLYVGAEAGDMPCLLSSWGVRTILVEPNWLAWPSIRATYEANDLMPLACFDGFAADATPTGFMVDVGDWPSATLNDYTAAHDFRTLHEYPDLARATADDLVNTVGEPIQLVSIDVEGAEGRVLAGMGGTLAMLRPYVFVSLHREDWLEVYGDTHASVDRLMTDAGYDKVWLTSEPHESHIMWVPSEKMWPR